jgi:outer membrane protein, multidrug efflux system
VRSTIRAGLSAGLLALLAACAPSTPFVPATPPQAPPQYKNAAAAESNLTRKWWLVYDDPLLTELVETTLRDNPYTEIGLMRVAQARALVQAAAADGRVQVKAETSLKNSHSSQTTPLGKLLGGQSISGNEFAVGIGGGWQIDLWNRVANAIEAAKARADAAEIFARNVELVLSMEVAVTYWRYRGADAELLLLGKMRARRAEAVELLTRRLEAGVGDERFLTRAYVELGNAEADIVEATKRRTLMEQELATLAVKPLKDFAVPPDPAYRMPNIPAVTPGVPALILARRPDLAETSQTIRELLAQQAIAEAAFYPTIALTGNFGFASEQLGDLLRSDSRQFSIGPLALSLPILDGGRNEANLDAARARYREAVNVHRSKLLIALREVDDALTEVQAARDQVRVRTETLRAAQRLVAIARSRYEEGDASYIDVAWMENEALSVERDMTRNQVEGLLATVRLITALGGGWH